MAMSLAEIESLLSSLADSNAKAVGAQGLPPRMYTDPAYFQLEMETIYAGEWLCVGRAESIPEPDDYLSTEILGEPLIIVRGEDGTIRTLSAVCPHRGMIITAVWDAPPDRWTATQEPASGNARHGFRCPYHFWNFDCSGRLRSAPHMDRTVGFDKADHNLASVRTEIWNGFIFVNLDGAAAPLASRLTRVDALISAYKLETLTTLPQKWVRGLPFNWKIMVENFFDGYHPDFLHTRYHDFAPNNLTEVLDFAPEDGALVAHVWTTGPDGGFNPTFKALFPILPDLDDDHRRMALFFWVAPNLMVGCNPDHAFWFTLAPTDVGHVDIAIGYLLPQSTIDMPRFPGLAVMNELGVNYIVNQDVPVNIAIQRGKRSRFAPRGAMSWQEEALATTYRWHADRLARRAEALRRSQAA
jgi:phenylpropionate dioxygenase-like ring-hydroxylating dioxygenase large terminal subunit